MAVKLFDSFSFLFIHFKRGDGVWRGDDKNSLYFFGSMREAAIARKDEFGYDYVMSELDKAEKDGRVFWREHIYLMDEGNRETFQRMLAKAREMGAEIPEWNELSKHYDAFWNIPAMRKFFESGAKNLDTPFRI